MAAQTCATSRYASASLTLDETTLRRFYQVGGRYVCTHPAGGTNTALKHSVSASMQMPPLQDPAAFSHSSAPPHPLALAIPTVPASPTPHDCGLLAHVLPFVCMTPSFASADAVSDLRLESPYDRSPCTAGVSRWAYRGAAVSGACAAGASLQSSTLATIVAAISTSADAGSNALVRDVYVGGGGGECSDVAALGATVAADGGCWEHVHPQLHDVYDLSFWVVSHPGGEYAIKSFAIGGGASLSFPLSHMMSRWKLHSAGFPRLGRLGDIVDFASLPPSVQSGALADAFGSAQLSAGLGAAAEACGSPGEVANQPSFPNRYRMYLTGNDADGEPSDTLSMHGEPGRSFPARQGKNTVWTMQVLFGGDQLRQRVAWGFAQIFVVSDKSGKWKEVEAWQAYYDIFVRHAFGNFRDMLREVSYSPMMANYLTMLENKGYAYSSTYPDENYAREIMQRARQWGSRSELCAFTKPPTTPLCTYCSSTRATGISPKSHERASRSSLSPVALCSLHHRPCRAQRGRHVSPRCTCRGDRHLLQRRHHDLCTRVDGRGAAVATRQHREL